MRRAKGASASFKVGSEFMEDNQENSTQNVSPSPKKDNGQLKKRTITGIFYVIIMAGVLVMKILIPTYYSDEYMDVVRFGDLGVDLLFFLISMIGSYEFLRAVGNISPVQKWVTIVTCSLMIPAFVISKILFGLCVPDFPNAEASLIIMLSVGSLGAMLVASAMVFDHEKSRLHSTACSEFCILYCGALVSVGSHINHMMTNSNVAILFMLVLVPFVDTAAYTFGKLFGKVLPYKLAPKTSPNKTIVGAVGGVIGGLLAAVLVWVLTVYAQPYFEFKYDGVLPSLVSLMLISLPTSILAQLGDLFESAIKRDCGVKDMGNILP
ncbi:MAG: phosphatidate cytidylyltransferase, partial [Clostridia bacterium]|nr:phosphatidate cytidylyltransferase [Clostridia bacterium]